MKFKVFVATILFGALVSLPFSASAATGFSFGGRVTAEYVCNTGLLVYLKSSAPPFLVFPVMWLWGELPFLSYIPPHPGQQLLGVAAPATVPCVLGYVPIGVGFPIEFHGSSI